MNCATIDTILDEHRVAGLSSAERHAVAAHAQGCTRCADGWAANDALMGEVMEEPPVELMARIGRLVEARMDRAQPQRHRRALGIFATAIAVVAAVLLLARPWSVTDPPATVQAGSAHEEPVFVAGRDYQVLARPSASVSSGRVAVIEFFMWPCLHCYALEPELESWGVRSREVVALTYVPVIFNPQSEMLARAFYAAESLGKGGEMHAAFYEEIHKHGNPLSSRESLVPLFARFGVDATAFVAAFDSPAVDRRVREAAMLAREYGIEATPTLVIAGRYSTNPGLAGDHMLAVADQLVAGERR
jgi:thiol:disulfide interchange protein DsbA